MEIKLINIYILFCCFLSTITVTIDVSTLEELKKAIEKARAGQIISIAPGEYDYSINERMIRFDVFQNGTESNPITITAKDPNNPPLIKGSGMSVLFIAGNYWVIENIKISGASKGIVIENSNYNIIRNVEVFNVGAQGIVIRGTSLYNLVENCHIYNTGRVDPSFGDGLTIGKTIDENRFTFDSNYNIIKGCIFRNITSEPIKINEYTTGNEIVGNTFFGDEINGRRQADCFIRISGDDNYIHDNVAHRNLNKNIIHAFKVEKHVEDSGDGNKFVNNVLFMDSPYGGKNNDKRMYIVDGFNTTFYVKNNIVDYGEGLINAYNKEYYNFGSITFLE